MIISGNKINGGAFGINENGTYTISVNVPKNAKMEQKVVDVTEFGEQVITPSEGYDGMSEVTLNVNTPKLNATNGTKFFLKGDNDLRNVDTSSMTTMKNMFSDDWLATSLNLSGWDVSNVTTMERIFFACESLKTVNMSGWDMSNLTDDLYWFNGCELLTEIIMDGAVLPKISLRNCYFHGLNLTIDSLVSIMNALPTNDTGSPLYLYFDTINLAKLTDEQKAIAIDKGWEFL